jgi:HAE1 family hydrophobic/amphiphilic exporter-1
MLFAQFFRKDKVFAKERKVFSDEKHIRFKRYRSILEKVLNYKAAWIAASFAVIVATAFLLPHIGSEYMPQSDTRAISVDITLTNGTPLSRTSATVNQIESQLQQLFEGQLDKIYSHIGPQQSQSGIKNENVYNENKATVKLIFREDIELDIAPVTAKLSAYFEALPGIEARFSNDESALYSVMGEDEMPLVVEVSGTDFQKLKPLSDSILLVMAANEHVYDPVSNLEEGVPQIHVDVDKYRAGMLNLSIDDVIVQIKDQLEGKNAGTIERGGEMQDIKIKVPEVSLAGLGNIKIKSGQREFPLSELANVNVEYASNSIYRRNQTRTVSIGARVNPDEPYDKVVKSIQNSLSQLSVPPQYKIKVAGQEIRRQESVANLTFALILSIILVYMVLASQFESLLHPFTILLTIPFAVVGAILAFFVLGMPLNMMGYIGIILLGGIAVNNSIMIVDCINQNKESGMPLREAILDAAERRLRPIMMTTLSTILGLLPLTLGFGESAALRSPIAIAVIGGMVTSTLLTLIIIPCYYESIENIVNRISRKKEVKIEVSHG